MNRILFALFLALASLCPPAVAGSHFVWFETNYAYAVHQIGYAPPAPNVGGQHVVMPHGPAGTVATRFYPCLDSVRYYSAQNLTPWPASSYAGCESLNFWLLSLADNSVLYDVTSSFDMCGAWLNASGWPGDTHERTLITSEPVWTYGNGWLVDWGMYPRVARFVASAYNHADTITVQTPGGPQTFNASDAMLCQFNDRARLCGWIEFTDTGCFEGLPVSQ